MAGRKIIEIMEVSSWENPGGFAVTSSIAGECFWITGLLIVE